MCISQAAGLSVSFSGLRPLSLGVLAFASTIGASTDTPVEIPDANLRQCVERRLDKEGTQITRGDMESLWILSRCDGVSNLDGLEFATNLLDFSSNGGGVSDLSPIADLPSLGSLALTNHRIDDDDLEIVAGLDLLYLWLSGNPISDLTPLAHMEQLARLWLIATRVTDLSPLVDLPLKQLEVHNTRIRNLPHWPLSAPLVTLGMGWNSAMDISPLARLTSLTELGLGAMNLGDLDLTVLPRLTSLNSLDLTFAVNVDLESLAGVRDLNKLIIRGARLVSDLSSLAHHTSLRDLDLAGTGLRNLESVPSSVLASLHGVVLEGNLITEIHPLLRHGGELRQVNLARNPWLSRRAVEVDIPALVARGVEVTYDPPRGNGSDAARVGDPALRQALARFLIWFGEYDGYVYEEPPADKLAKVPMLSLPNKGIASLHGMEQATSLWYLDLTGNHITDISSLADLPLNLLFLGGNPIDDFGPLMEMEGRLIYLALDNMSLREVPALPQTLSNLFLTGNSITDLEPLAWAGEYYTFNELWLSGNSISSLLPLTGFIHHLHLNDNEVADLAGLNVVYLRELHIRNNALRDISPLLYATSLRMLDAERNPLGEEALTVAETLRERGAVVLMGEPVPFLPAAGALREGLVRVVNRGGEGGEVFIEAWDDAGVRFGPARLRMDGRSAVHFTSTDLQSGNAGLGLAGIGPPTSGDWRLTLTSPLDIEVLAYVRSADGFLTPMHDVAADATLPTLNPGSNGTRRSALRLVSRDAELTRIVVGGYDDGGSWEQMPKAVGVLPGQAWTASAAALEGEHGVGDGHGKWRLRVPGWPWFAMSLLDSASGHLTNLSTVPDNVEELADGRRRHRVPLLPADGGRRDGFVRVVNLGHLGGEVLIDAVDDAGASRGPVRLQLDARQTVHFNAGDLAQGNAAKGLDGAVGTAQGDWRLTLTSTLDLLVLSYVRTPDGYLASMHDVVPIAEDGTHRMPFFNPGSNAEQLSKLRLLNHGGAAVSATVTGIDDAGQASTEARVNVPAGAALTVTAAELEAGGDSVSGRLGDGEGRWRLRLAADGPLTVMNLLESPEGHLANMSTVTHPD